MQSAIIKTIIGNLKMVEDHQKLIELSFTNEIEDMPKTPFLKNVQKELEEYFRGERKTFNIPITLSGTDFEKKVYQALMDIPYGTVCSYKQIAKQIGNEKACRAIGQANHKNRIIIIVPCHRVIQQDGRIGGYGGGIDKKRLLLNIEGSSL